MPNSRLLGHYILDEYGDPYPIEDLLKWADFFSDLTKRRVGETTFMDPDIRISTVFLGLDHEFGGGPPLLFETLVESPDPMYDDVVARYQTWEGALEGHLYYTQTLKELFPGAKNILEDIRPKPVKPEDPIIRKTFWERLRSDELIVAASS